MSEERYKQCTLSKGESRTVGYIPERAAKVGALVELVDYNNEFWTVESVPTHSVSKEFVRSAERLFKQFQGSTKGGTIDA